MIQVKDKNGNIVREYSEEIHGPKFAELAEQFATSSGYIISKNETTMSEEETKVAGESEAQPENATQTETPTETATSAEETGAEQLGVENPAEETPAVDNQG